MKTVDSYLFRNVSKIIDDKIITPEEKITTTFIQYLAQ